MKAKRIGIVVALLLSTLPMIAAIVDGSLWTAVFRGSGVVFLGVLTYKLFRDPPAPRAWTRRQTVLSLVLLLPMTLLVIGTVAWVAIVNDDPVLRAFCLLVIALVLAGTAFMARTARHDHLTATRQLEQP